MPEISEELASEAYRVDDRGVTHARVFTVEAFSPPNAISVLANKEGVQRGAVYRDAFGNIPDPSLVCQELTVTVRAPATIGNKGLFEVVARYEIPQSPVPEPDGAAVWTVETATENKPVDVDTTGAAILNAAQEPIDPPMTAPFVSEVLVATWIRTSTDFFDALSLSRQYRNRVNSVAWKGADAREVYCHSLHPQEMQPNTIKYTARFEFKDTYTVGSTSVPGWDKAFVQRGWRWKDGTKTVGGKTVPNWVNSVDETGKDTTRPVLLAADGTLLADSADPVFDTKQVINSADFNALGI